jgi:hypothetical protein
MPDDYDDGADVIVIVPEGYEPYYAEDDTLAGFAFVTTNDEIAYADLAGEIVAVEDDRGDVVPVEPGHYVDDDEYPGLDYEVEPEPDGYEDNDEFDDEFEIETVDLMRQLEREAAKRGFDFTRAELLPLFERAREHLEAGREINVPAIMEELRAEGQPPPNLDKPQDRQEWMVQRLQDDERDARQQQLDEPDPGSLDAYNEDDRHERVLRMSEQLEGKDVGPAYSQSELDVADAQ